MDKQQQKSNLKRINGNGSFTYLANSRKYRYRFYLPDDFLDENGKRIRLSVSADTQKECRAKAQEITNQYIMKKRGITSVATIKDVCELLNKQLMDANLIREVSYLRRSETLKILEPVYDQTIVSLSADVLQDFLNSLTEHYSNSTITKVFQTLRRALEYSYDKGILSVNIVKELKKPKAKTKEKKTRALTVEESQRFVKNLSGEWIHADKMLLMLLTGFRMGEILALMPEDINLKDKTVYIHKMITRDKDGHALLNNDTKTDAGERTNKVCDDAITILERNMKGKKPGELIFTSRGKSIVTSAVNSAFRRYVNKYDIITPIPGTKVSLHSLRHTYATRCIESGMPAVVLQHLLGHSDVEITLNTYTDVFEQFANQNIDKASEYFMSLGLICNRKDVAG